MVRCGVIPPSHHGRLPWFLVLPLLLTLLAMDTYWRITHEEGYWAENAQAIIGVTGLSVLLLAGFVWNRLRSRAANDDQRPAPRRYVDPTLALDTVVVGVAVRLPLGESLLTRRERWSALPGDGCVAEVTRALLDQRAAWSQVGCLDDEPVPEDRAPDRIAQPLDRLEAALPHTAATADYRGGDTRVVVVVLGATSLVTVPNLGSRPDADAVADLLAEMASHGSWRHARVVVGGPLDPTELAALPFPFTPA